MTYMPKKLDRSQSNNTVNTAQLSQAVRTAMNAQAQRTMFQKAASAAPLPEPMPEPPRSRIKMIATGFGHMPYRSAAGELEDGFESIPYALTHDDRIFKYNSIRLAWDELPPLPE